MDTQGRVTVPEVPSAALPFIGFLYLTDGEILAEVDTMFEHETDAVRLDIVFLSTLMEKDYRTDPSYDPEDLKDKLLEIEGDINTLLGNLPYEAIDDNEELEHQYPEEFEDNEELEDEVVECDTVIPQARTLLEAVKER